MPDDSRPFHPGDVVRILHATKPDVTGGIGIVAHYTVYGYGETIVSVRLWRPADWVNANWMRLRTTSRHSTLPPRV